MPQVPRVNPERIQERGLPQNRLPQEAPAEAFGGGAVAAGPGAAAQGLANLGLEIAVEEQEKANKILFAQHDITLAEEALKLRTQLEGVKGTEALQASQDVVSEYQSVWDSMEQNITSPAVARDLMQSFQARKLSLQGFAEPYAAKEVRAYNESVTKQYLDKEMESTIAEGLGADNKVNGFRVGLGITRINNQIDRLQDQLGKDNIWASNLKRDSESSIHRRVIDRLDANQNYMDIKPYFDANKDKIFGDDLLHCERMTQSGTLKGRSNELLMKAMRKFEEYRDSAPAAAAQVDEEEYVRGELKKLAGKDVELYDAANARLKVEYSEQRAADARQHNQNWEAAFQMISDPQYADDGVMVRGLPPGVGSAKDLLPGSVWFEMTPKEQEAAERHFGFTHGQKPYVMSDADYDEWLSFLAMSEEKVAALKIIDFKVKYWSRFDKATRAKAETMWNSARDAINSPSARAKFQGLKSDAQMVIDEMGKAGISGISEGMTAADLRLYPGSRAAYKRMSDSLERAMLAYRDSTGKNMGDDEKKAALKKLIDIKVYRTEEDALEEEGSVSLGTLTRDEKTRMYVGAITAAQEKRILTAAHLMGITLDRTKTLDQMKMRRAWTIANSTGDEELIEAVLRGKGVR